MRCRLVALAALIVFTQLAVPAPAVAAVAATTSGGDDPPPKNAALLRPLGFFAHGMSVGYERFLLPPRWSFVVLGAFENGASGDFSSTTWALGGEARYWLGGHGPFARHLRDVYAMMGPFLFARAEVARTTLNDDVDGRGLGTAWTFTETAGFAWRFGIGRFEVSPSTGLVVITDASRHLVPQTHGSFAVGLTLGYLW